MSVSLSFFGGAGWQFFDDNGDPLSGGKIYVYAAGTTTPLTTYTSSTGLTPNSNPIILDAAGRTPQQIWVTDTQLYKYVVKTSDDTLVRTWDNIGAGVFSSDLANTTDNAKGDALIGFKQSNSSGFLTGAVARTVNDKLQETISFKDFGAVGDGITDDTAAITTAFAVAGARLVVGVSGEIYRITSTITLNGNNFDGRDCTIRKDFAGSGIAVTGGPVYTYLRNFKIDTSTAQTATDYDASATNHGIDVTNTRVEAYNVASNGHKGAGFYMNNTAPNMNKSKYINISANGNALAGCYMTGNFPAADDMSVWEFNGRFQSNMGYGIFTTTTCPLRQVDMWLYCESNFLGASASGLTTAGSADFGSIRSSRIWAYVEQKTVGLELVLRANCSGNYVQSVRANTDEDYNGANLWFWSAGRLSNPSTPTPRQVTLPGFIGALARVGRDGEYCRVPIVGNGGTFGTIEGLGSLSGTPQLRMLASDLSTYASVYTGNFEHNASFERYGTNSRQYANFSAVVPVGNQIKITVTVTDMVPRQGTGLLDIYLAANTDSNPSRYYHKAYLAFSARNGSGTSAWDTAETVQASAGFTLASVTVTGLQAVLLYNLNSAIIGVSGYVLCHGTQGYMASAVLSAP